LEKERKRRSNSLGWAKGIELKQRRLGIDWRQIWCYQWRESLFIGATSLVNLFTFFPFLDMKYLFSWYLTVTCACRPIFVAFAVLHLLRTYCILTNDGYGFVDCDGACP
jgi:hypothetical protein